jgi:hypothetical protein
MCEALREHMARNLYILSATLVLLAAVSCGMAMVTPQPGIPSEAPTWKTIGLFLLLGGLGVALLGTLTALFEQVDRRAEIEKQRQRGRRSRG